MQSPPLLPGQAEAAPGELALTLAASRGPVSEPSEVSLNPLGEWVIVVAWTTLLAVNLWTWRVLLKPRPAAPEAQ